MLDHPGIIYDYFFKDYPRNFFSWLKLSTKSAQTFGHLSGNGLRVAENISKLSDYFQIGLDIPFAFQNFRSVYEQHRGYVPSSEPLPLWVEVCQAVSNVIFLTEFGRHHLFNQRRSSVAELVGMVADLVEKFYDFYNFVNQRQIEADRHQVSLISEEEFQAKKTFSFQKLAMFSWDIQNIAQLVHKVSRFVLIALSVIGLYLKVDDYSPKATIFFTTVYLSSHLIYSYKLKMRDSFAKQVNSFKQAN